MAVLPTLSVEKNALYSCAAAARGSWGVTEKPNSSPRHIFRAKK